MKIFRPYGDIMLTCDVSNDVIPRSDLDRGISVTNQNSGWLLCSDSVLVFRDSKAVIL